MKFFKKKAKESTGMPETETVSLSTILPNGSLHPIPLEHSYKFYVDGIDPLNAERARLKNRSVDWLLHDMRDSAIEADSRAEISYGKKQHINIVHTIDTIIAKNKGDKLAAEELEKLILEEIAYYDKLDAELTK